MAIAVCVTASLPAAAQEADANLVPNGGFEEWEQGGIVWRPKFWSMDYSLGARQIKDNLRPNTKGVSALAIYAYGNIGMNREIAVEAGKKYRFSFWFKSTKRFHEVEALFTWYSGSAYKGRARVLTARAQKADTWAEAKVEITVPEGVDKIGAIHLLPERSFSNPPQIFLDDVTLVASTASAPPAVTLEAPRDLRVTTHQGELEFSWAKPQNAEGVTWEVVFNNGPSVPVSTASYICTKLRPGTVYRMKVRALRGTEQSPYTERQVSTERMEQPEYSEDRIPYLRTLLPDGTSPGRFLDLYYNELANPEATITYRIDGRSVVPVNNRLEFPAFTGFHKNFQLEIHIDEGGGREWEILYNELNVRNINNH